MFTIESQKDEFLTFSEFLGCEPFMIVSIHGISYSIIIIFSTIDLDLKLCMSSIVATQ
jgi:hypothetical protein